VGYNEQVSLSGIKKPSDFLILGDAARSLVQASRGGLYPMQIIAPSDVTQARMIERHGNLANVAFADGHSEPTTFQNSWDKRWWFRNP
jgi:prepilin-type processing-associated H-X9-DG protein